MTGLLQQLGLGMDPLAGRRGAEATPEFDASPAPGRPAASRPAPQHRASHPRARHTTQSRRAPTQDKTAPLRTSYTSSIFTTTSLATTIHTLKPPCARAPKGAPQLRPSRRRPGRSCGRTGSGPGRRLCAGKTGTRRAMSTRKTNSPVRNECTRSNRTRAHTSRGYL